MRCLCTDYIIPGQFKLREIFLLTADPGMELPLILYGVALEVLLLLTGVVVVAVQTFFADKVSFWSICWVCLGSFASPLTISSTCSRACVNISGFQTSREWGQRWCLGSLHQGQGSGQRGWCPTWDGYHGPRCNLLQCCSRCTRPDQAIVVEGIMVQLAIMVHDIWFNLYAQYECWSNHSYMKSRPFCSRLPQGNSVIADTLLLRYHTNATCPAGKI